MSQTQHDARRTTTEEHFDQYLRKGTPPVAALEANGPIICQSTFGGGSRIVRGTGDHEVDALITEHCKVASTADFYRMQIRDAKERAALQEAAGRPHETRAAAIKAEIEDLCRKRGLTVPVLLLDEPSAENA